jgi:hypothetical protein
VSLGWANLALRQTSTVSQKAVEEYNEILQETVYNLQLRLQQIDENLGKLTKENNHSSNTEVDLEDEKAVTKQCLHICEDAKAYLHELLDKESSVLGMSTSSASNSDAQEAFPAQSLARNTLELQHDDLGDVINQLQNRLRSLFRNSTSENDVQRNQLQADLEITRQCLSVCKIADEISRQKVFKVGEVVVEDNSDNLVINTAADLFDVTKAFSRNNSALVVSSTSEAGLRLLVERHHNSRFAATEQRVELPTTNISTPPSASGAQRGKNSTTSEVQEEQTPRSGASTKTRQQKPSPNEIRKRVPEDDADER